MKNSNLRPVSPVFSLRFGATPLVNFTNSLFRNKNFTNNSKYSLRLPLSLMYSKCKVTYINFHRGDGRKYD